MRIEAEHRGVRTAVVICLAAFFFLLAMGVTLLGSSVYRAAAADADENAAHRTALSYVVNQIRRGDAGGVVVGSFGGVDALRLSEVGDDGTIYVTLIYCYGGSLRELYMEEGTGLLPEDGVPIMELDSLVLTAGENGVLTITAARSGMSWSVSLAPRSGLQEVGAL